ncbi:hypothetical protein F4680DRAFT_465190 [Xylaria scruposa]|nr:hypothetical protein F4680DRAFT_465190 [Xylaria scruposa]
MTDHAKIREAEQWVDYFTNLARKIRHIWANLATPSFAQFSEAPPPTAQPHIEIKHDSCQVSMSVNTDDLAADWSMREEKHAERVPCRNRDGPEAGPRTQQNVFGDAAQQQKESPQKINMQYTNSSTTITVYNNGTRSAGLNFGVNGLGVGVGLGGGVPGIGNQPFSLAIDGNTLANTLVVAACMLLAIWFFRG